MKKIDGQKILYGVFTILVTVCDWDDQTDQPVYAVLMFLNSNCGEMPVRGGLGDGGKLYFEGDKLLVGCAPEDLNAERSEMIEKANALLQKWVDAAATDAEMSGAAASLTETFPEHCLHCKQCTDPSQQLCEEGFAAFQRDLGKKRDR